MTSIVKKQQEIIDNMDLFEDWESKYSYIISMGKQLPKFPKEKQNSLYIIKGCQSQVWFDCRIEDNKLFFEACSDAIIVSGLIAMLLHVYNGATPQEILSSSEDFINKIGLNKNLSLTRNNGLSAMIGYIYSTAKKYVNNA